MQPDATGGQAGCRRCRTGRGRASRRGSAGPSGGAVRPTRERTVAASRSGSRRGAARRGRGGGGGRTPRAAVRRRSAGPGDGTAPSSRTRRRESRGLGVDHAGRGLLPQGGPRLLAPVRPPRRRSARRCSSSVAPAVIRSARRSARRRAAAGTPAWPQTRRRARWRPTLPLLGPARPGAWPSARSDASPSDSGTALSSLGPRVTPAPSSRRNSPPPHHDSTAPKPRSAPRDATSGADVGDRSVVRRTPS
ncbi:hypothetical protein STENM223S_08424 [Streptomyces tendae]